MDTPATVTAPGEPPEVTLVDLLTWLGRDKRRLGRSILVGALIALVIAFLLPVKYTAHVALLPPDKQAGGGAAAAMLALGGELASLGGLTKQTSAELYVALLQSDTVLHDLDDRFKLRERYDVDTFEAFRKKVKDIIEPDSDKKSGLITLDVTDKDPAFAATLANGSVEALKRLLSHLAVTEAQMRRDFYTTQLRNTQEALVQADLDLQRTQERSGMVLLDKQSEVIIGTVAQLRAQAAAAEINLKVLRRTLAEDHPDVVHARAQLEGLREQLARLDESQVAGNGVTALPARPGSGAGGHGAVDLPVGRIPAVAGDYVRALREVKFQEALLEGVLKQYELARMDVAKEGDTVQVVDAALPPDHKSKPKRALIVLAGALLGLLVGMARAVGREVMELSRQDPRSGSALDGMLNAWRWR